MKKSRLLKVVFALLLGLSVLVPTTNASADTVTDPSNLGNGTYDVKAYLWHASNDAASMAAAVLTEDAELVVVDGVYTLKLKFVSANIMTMDADLQKMLYYTNATEAGNADNGTEVNVISTRTGDTGEVVPDEVSFDLPEAGAEYVYARVYYMNNNGSECRIKIDYNLDNQGNTSVDTTALEDKIIEAKGISSEGYTISSYSALLNAIEIAEAVLVNTEATQSQINAQVTALNTAINNLVPADGTVVDDALEDGIYELPVALWKEASNEPSMAAAAINGTARVIVEEGYITKMYLYTQPMTFGTITASLQTLKISTLARTFTLANVETRDSAGNPTSFSFALPHTEEYLDVLVNPGVDMMGNTDIAARLKISYDEMKKVSNDIDLTQAPSSTTTNPTTTKGVNTSDVYNSTAYLALALMTVLAGVVLYKKQRSYE